MNNNDDMNEKIVITRIKKIEQVIAAIRKVIANQPLDKKVIASRYMEGLPHINRRNLSMLADDLQQYVNELK